MAKLRLSAPLIFLSLVKISVGIRKIFHSHQLYFTCLTVRTRDNTLRLGKSGYSYKQVWRRLCYADFPPYLFANCRFYYRRGQPGDEGGSLEAGRLLSHGAT